MIPFGKHARKIARLALESKQAVVGVRVRSGDHESMQIYVFQPMSPIGGTWDLVYKEDPHSPSVLMGPIREAGVFMDMGYPENNPFQDPSLVNRVLRENLRRMAREIASKNATIAFFKPYESSKIEIWPPSKEDTNRLEPP